MNRRSIAKDTVEILERGFYTTDKKTVSIAEALRNSVENTVHYRVDDFDEVKTRCEALLTSAPRVQTKFSVENETTLEAAVRLSAEADTRHLMALNFASAKNPGGGFLSGAEAQEESIARSSGLYATQTARFEFYEHNRSTDNCLYCDAMLWSPEVPVFRKDNGDLLDTPYTMSILTSPAVNKGCLTNNDPDLLKFVLPVQRERTVKMLSLCLLHGSDTLILGAWGCGVFRNDPSDIAEDFDMLLRNGGMFEGVFRRIHFAVYDTTRALGCFKAFERRFAS